MLVINILKKLNLKLNEKFASDMHSGPADVAAFLGISDENESARIRQDAYQKIHYLVSKLCDGND